MSGEYFYGGDEVNAASAVMKELEMLAVVNPPGTNEADLVQSVTGKVYVAKSPETFTYDDDGNMLGDGRFTYTWDGENRLVSIETSAAAASAGAPRVRVEYTYDNRSRRIGNEISHFEDDTWTVAESRAFVYDGWNMIRETIRNQQSAISNSLVWGLDLSGSLQGAGGVGGLLAVISPLPLGEGSTVYLPCYNANGNVMEYVSTDGTIVAHYEYSPFGETVIQSGELADAFSFRFSTKYWENEAKLYYYGYRFYVSGVGRWLNRDPIGKNGGVMLYGFVLNSPPNDTDYLGHMKGSVHVIGPKGRNEVEYHDTRDLFGGLYPGLFNACDCNCKKSGPFELSCELDISYYISIANEGSSVWKIEKPKDFPSDPLPPNWDSLSYKERVKHILAHEKRHLQVYKQWHAKRKDRIEVFESLQYPTKSGCEMRAEILVGENSTEYAALCKAQESHEGW